MAKAAPKEKEVYKELVDFLVDALNKKTLICAYNAKFDMSFFIKKVVFNIDVLPIVKIISSIFVHVFFVLVMVLLYILYGYYPGIEILQLVYYSLCMVALVASLAYLTSAISIFFKDMSQIISIIMPVSYTHLTLPTN